MRRSARCTSAEVTCGTLDSQSAIAQQQAADVWALAAVLLFAWAGSPPYGTLSAGLVQQQHARQEMPNLHHARRQLPAQICQILKECFRLSPSQRPSADSLLSHLQAFARLHAARAGAGSLDVIKLCEVRHALQLCPSLATITLL